MENKIVMAKTKRDSTLKLHHIYSRKCDQKEKKKKGKEKKRQEKKAGKENETGGKCGKCVFVCVRRGVLMPCVPIIVWGRGEGGGVTSCMAVVV